MNGKHGTMIVLGIGMLVFGSALRAQRPTVPPQPQANRLPAIGPSRANRGSLVEKPARIDTPVGTLADFGNYMTPKLSRRVLHQLYLSYPDSAAARGVTPAEPSISGAPSRRPKRPARGVKSLRVLRPVTSPMKRAVRSLPGVHW